jgi:hypothetical protein
MNAATIPALRAADFQFGMSSRTLKRRRPALLLLGLVFVEDGRGSYYARRDLTDRLSTTHQAERGFSPAPSKIKPGSGDQRPTSHDQRRPAT